MTNTINLNNNAKEIHTPQIAVQKNVLSFPDYFLQISNISQVSVAPIPKKKKGGVYFLAVLLCIVGLIFLITAISIAASQASRSSYYSSYSSYNLTSSSNNGAIALLSFFGVVSLVLGIVIIYIT